MKSRSSLPSSQQPVILLNKMSHTTVVTALIARWHSNLCGVQCGLTESTVGTVSHRDVLTASSLCARVTAQIRALCQHFLPWDDVISREKCDNLFLYNEWQSMWRYCCCQQEGTANCEKVATLHGEKLCGSWIVPLCQKWCRCGTF